MLFLMEKNIKCWGYRGEHSYDFKCHFTIHLEMRHGVVPPPPAAISASRTSVLWLEVRNLSPVSARSSLVLSVSKHTVAIVNFITSVKSLTIYLNSTISLKHISHKKNNHRLSKIGKENSSTLPSFTIYPCHFSSCSHGLK